MLDDKIKFYFPSKILKQEDFEPIESSILKDYYRDAFLKIIDKVRKKNNKNILMKIDGNK